jgi:hypothetical protein
MKSIFLFLSMVCFTLISFGQTTNAYYDDTLARKLYADEYGFKNMVRLLYLNTSIAADKIWKRKP